MASVKKKSLKSSCPIKAAGLPIINIYDIGFFDEATNSINVIAIRGESAYKNWQDFRERAKKELGLAEEASVSLYRDKEGTFYYKRNPMG